MTHTYMEHQRNVLVGIIAGLLAGVFFSIFETWKDKEWYLASGIPLFALCFYFILITPYNLVFDERKKK